MQAVQVQCAGCRSRLNVPPTLHEFPCPKCQLRQTLPYQLRHTQNLQVPCVNCRALLNVPVGLVTFNCPACQANLSLNPERISSLLSSRNAAPPTPPGTPTLQVQSPQGVGPHPGVATLSPHGVGLLPEMAPVQLQSPSEVATLNVNVPERSTLLPARPDVRLPWSEEMMRGTSRNYAALSDYVNEVASEVETEEDEPEVAQESYATYRPQGAFGSLPQPELVLEPTALAAVEPPPLTYVPKVTSEGLSAFELETMLHVCQRHQQQLDGGPRSGFLLEDSQGLRTSQIIAGLIMESEKQGRRKALWVTGHEERARHVLDSVGAGDTPIHVLDKLPFNRLDSTSINIREGVLLASYVSLTATSAKGRSRLSQLATWLGPQFDGLVVLDQCSRGEELYDTTGKLTAIGEAVIELQTQLPLARVLYCSSAGLPDACHLAHLVRLGLWGPRTPFQDFHTFQGSMEKLGQGVIQLVAMELKARGALLSRSLGFQGTSAEIIPVPMEPDYKDMYSMAAQFWGELQVDFLGAAEALGGTLRGQGAGEAFWRTRKQFFRCLCLAGKISTTVQIVKAVLYEGKCAIVGLRGDESAQDDELSDFQAGPRELLLKLIEEHYPIPPIPDIPADTDWEPQPVVGPVSGTCTICDEQGVNDTNGNLCALCQKAYHFKCRQSASAKLCVACEASVQEIKDEQVLYYQHQLRRHELTLSRKAHILSVTHKLDLPKNPLDDLVAQLGGTTQVAELTPREGVFKIANKTGGALTWRPRIRSGESLALVNTAETLAFLEGKKLIAVVTDPSALKGVLNQKPRVLIALELTPNPRDLLQHITPNLQALKFVVSPLRAEREFAAATVQRLGALGARHASYAPVQCYGSSAAKEALKVTYQTVLAKHAGLASSNPRDPHKDNGFFTLATAAFISGGLIQGATALPDSGQWQGGPWLESPGDIRSANLELFLDRLSGLELAQQNLLFEFYAKTLEDLIAKARTEGHWESGIYDISAPSACTVGEPTEVYRDPASGARTLHYLVRIDRGMQLETAKKLKAEAEALGASPDNGFYYSNKDFEHRHHYLLALAKPSSGGRLFTIFRPSTGRAPKVMTLAKLQEKYTKMRNMLAAETGWVMEYDAFAEKCMHGPRCQWGAACTVGRRVHEMHLLSGVVLPVWNVLVSALSESARVAHRRLRVVRLKATVNRGQVVGIHVPSPAVGVVLQALREARPTRR